MFVNTWISLPPQLYLCSVTKLSSFCRESTNNREVQYFCFLILVVVQENLSHVIMYYIQSIWLRYFKIVYICQWGGVDTKYISQFQFYAQTCWHLASNVLTLNIAAEFWRLKKAILSFLLVKLCRKTSLSPFTNFRRPQKSSLQISPKNFYA